MSTITAPVALVVGATVRLPQPTSGQLSAVILDNLSAYLLQVNVGANVSYQSPWSGAVYALDSSTSSPVSVMPIAPSGQIPPEGSEQVNPTWYFAGEKVPALYPTSLVSNALAASVTGGEVTVTGNVAVTNGSPEPLEVSLPYPSQVTAGQLALTGAAQQLPNLDTPAGLRLAVTAASTAPAYIGGPAVTATSGLELAPGAAPIVVPVTNADQLYAAAAASSTTTLTYLTA